MNESTKLERNLGMAVLILLLLGSFVVMRPFVSALVWGVVLCFCLWPMQRQLIQWLKGRRTLAALITTLSITLVLVVPFVILGVSLADDARALGAATRRWLETGPPGPPAWLEKIPLVGSSAKAYWKEFAADAATLMQELRRAAEETSAEQAGPAQELRRSGPDGGQEASLTDSRLVRTLKSVVSSARSSLIKAGLAIGRGVVEVALSVFLTFFILRDGAAVADRLTVGVARIAGDRGRHLLEVAGKTVRGVVYGILGTALVQGVLAGVGFLIAGVPGAALLGLLTFFLSPVPVGPPLVWIPAAIWLFSQGGIGWGIFMLVWGLGVSSVDNLVKPWLISQGSAMPFILIFCGVIGGALGFGLIGIFLGPTILAVVYRLIEEWSAVSSTDRATNRLTASQPSDAAAGKSS
ncbi:MAG: AI-2E family transporter [Verrucomicrobia bacterium]|nr:AI-2E family transporter [Verrucomicrobiota bacterium]